MFDLVNKAEIVRFNYARLILALPLCAVMTLSALDQATAQEKKREIDVHIHVNGKPVLDLDHKVHVHDHVADKDRTPIDVAILLDTSNSMDGLISQAKSQLWKIVQKFATTEKNGALPKLRVSKQKVCALKI